MHVRVRKGTTTTTTSTPRTQRIFKIAFRVLCLGRVVNIVPAAVAESSDVDPEGEVFAEVVNLSSRFLGFDGHRDRRGEIDRTGSLACPRRRAGETCCHPFALLLCLDSDTHCSTGGVLSNPFRIRRRTRGVSSIHSRLATSTLTPTTATAYNEGRILL